MRVCWEIVSCRFVIGYSHLRLTSKNITQLHLVYLEKKKKLTKSDILTIMEKNLSDWSTIFVIIFYVDINITSVTLVNPDYRKKALFRY